MHSETLLPLFLPVRPTPHARLLLRSQVERKAAVLRTHLNEWKYPYLKHLFPREQEINA